MRSVSALLADRGIIVNTKVNKELFGGINTVKSYLKGDPPRLYVFRNCVNMIRELKTYAWGDDDAPVKRDDHCLDELRYYLMTQPGRQARARGSVRSAAGQGQAAAALARRRYGRP